MTNSEPSNDQFIDFQCPYCSSELSFPETKLGTAQECPFCFETVVVLPANSKMGWKLPLPIETPRLNLRPLRTEDLPDWLEFLQDEDSYTFLNDNAPNEEDATSWLANNIILRFTHPKGCLALGIEIKPDTKIIGYLSFYLTDHVDHRQATFHIMMHPAYRRKGYGTEALHGLISFGFTGVALHDIRVSIDNRNLAGRRMVEKAGMKLEGEFIEQCRVKGEWISTAYYAILSTWWQKRTVSPQAP